MPLQSLFNEPAYGVEMTSPKRLSRTPLALWLWIKSGWHKLRHDLGKEIVVATCAAVLGGLFTYIFTDFLNNQLALVSETVKEAGITWFSYAVILLGAVFSWSLTRQNSDQITSIEEWLYKSGESPAVRRWFRRLQCLFITSSIGLLVFVAIEYFFARSYPGEVVISYAAAFAASLFWSGRKNNLVESVKTQGLTNTHISYGPLRWRITMMTKRGRASKWMLRLSAVAILFLAVPEVARTPVTSWAAFFVVGNLVATALYFHFVDELRSSWVEKNAGLSHEKFMGICAALAALFGGIASFAGMVVFLGGKITFGEPLTEPILLMKLISSSLIPCLVVPNILLQIDPRRVSVNMMSGFLVSLFIATAVFAHIAAIVLVFALFYYGQTSQANRYYRA